MNTMGLSSQASEYYTINRYEDVFEIPWDKDPLIIGGGSNVLLPPLLGRPVVHMSINSMRIEETSDSAIIVESGAGKNWHKLVQHTVRMGWSGIENLALIPGQVGAAPVQNIGAYGVEIKDVLIDLKAYDRSANQIVELSKDQCGFGYRDSIFKGISRGKYVILSLRLRLHRGEYSPNCAYYAIKERLNQLQITTPTLNQMFDTVVAIRQSKLPDPQVLGNCGSFFKNPTIDRSNLDQVLAIDENIKYFEYGNNQYKLAAGYLIESCGWRGKRIGALACYERQALVIVNYGGATYDELINFKNSIKSSVFEKYSINLEEEVQIIKE